MILDLERSAGDAPNTDVCIVGAGAAGLFLAMQLIKKGKRVLLLEGGGARRFERRSQALNKSEIVGLPFTGAHSGRFRNLGGSTATWGGQIMELDESDFEQRSWVPGSGWPIAKSDLTPFYAEATVFEGLSDCHLNDGDLLAARGLHPPDLGDRLTFAYSRYCRELKFARICDDALTNHQDLLVYVHANVVALRFAERTGTVTAVCCRTVTGRTAEFKAAQFVFCLGGIESSRFLLQALGPGSAPWNVSGTLGRHIQDHVHCFSGEIVNVDLDSDAWHYGPDRVCHDNHSYLPKVKLSRAAQERYGVLNASGFAEYDDGLHPAMLTAKLMVTGPLSAITMRDLAYTLPRAPLLVWNYARRKLDPTYALPNIKLKLSVLTEQSPLSESRITLSDKRDAVGLFRARHHWHVSTQEIQTVRRYTEVVTEAFATRGLARIVPDPDLHDDARIVRKFRDTFHHMGGTRMAESSADGIVDPNLLLFGTENAYVCSTSVFPASGFANPTHTLLALAARLASHLTGVPTRHT